MLKRISHGLWLDMMKKSYTTTNHGRSYVHVHFIVFELILTYKLALIYLENLVCKAIICFMNGRYQCRLQLLLNVRKKTLQFRCSYASLFVATV